ncbi:MAG: LysM peptidoglycan-binding domain-containing M23 family metallopeptidase [Polyangiales bacterium]
MWAAALALAACNSPEKAPSAPAPAPKPTVSTPVADAPPPTVEHTVGEGETLWDIASTYGITLGDLMHANELNDRDVRKLSTGAKLVIPGATEVKTVVRGADARRRTPESLPTPKNGAYHQLADGETLWDLARTYDVDLEALMEANTLSDDDVRKLRPGDAIVVPGIKATQIKATTSPPARRGVTHVLAKGETVWDLASRFQVSVAEIMSANALDASRVTGLRDGTKLFIPGVTEDKQGHVRRERSASQERAEDAAKRLGLGTRKAAGELLSGRLRPEWIRAAGGTTTPRTLKWPVTNGTYVRGYGSGEGGYHLATDIRGDIGWNVRAAAPGIVGYAGNELRGFGNVVFVIHPGGWVTLYAHNSANFVVAGQRVERGSVTSRSQGTGIGRGPTRTLSSSKGGKTADPGAFQAGR